MSNRQNTLIRDPAPWQYVIAVVGIGAWLTLNIWSLQRYPVPSCDEALYGATAYNLLTTGSPRIPFYAVLENVNLAIAFGRLFIAGQALFMMLFSPSLFAVRLFGLTGVIALALATYALGSRLYDQRVGLWSALLVSTDWAVFQQGHSGRPDIWLAAGIMFALYLAFGLAEKPAAWRALIAGFAIALLEDIHLNGMHFILAVGVLVVIRLGFQERRWGMVALYGLGSLVGVAYVLGVHLLPDPAAAIAEYRTIVSSEGRAFWETGLASSLLSLLRWVGENFVTAQGGLAAVPALFYLPGIVMALSRRDDQRRSLLLFAFVLISLFSYGVVNVIKPNYYALLWRPALTLLGTAGVFWLADRWKAPEHLPGRVQSHLGTGLVALVLGVFVVGDVYLAYKFRSVDYAAYTAGLRDLIPEGSTVLADEPLWYGLKGREMTGTTYLTWYQFVHGASMDDMGMLREAFLSLGPEYVVLDEHASCASGPSAMHDFLAATLPQACVEVGTVEGAWFEPGTVYRCDPPERFD